MKKLLNVICVLALLMLASCKTYSLQYVSHAGDASSAPPHSLPAYKVAVEHNASILKLDLHETADGVIVMQHDLSLLRKMGLDAKISEMTYADILEKATYKPVNGFDQEKIVRLEQALGLVKETPMQLWLDFKSFKPSMADKVMAIMKEQGIGADRLMIATFTIPAIVYFQKNYPEVRRVQHLDVLAKEDGVYFGFDKEKNVVKMEEVPAALVAQAKKLGLHGYNFPVSSPAYTKETIRALKAAGLWVSVWFVQNEAAARKAVQFCADAVVTDYIEIVQAAAQDEEARK